MSGRSFTSSKKPSEEEIVAIQHIVFHYVRDRWKDYEGFSRSLTERILTRQSFDKTSISSLIRRFSHPFYAFNSISKEEFIAGFPFDQVIHRLKNMPRVSLQHVTAGTPVQYQKTPLSFELIFPEIMGISVTTARSLIPLLGELKERVIQDELRDALREKGASRIGERKSDSALEVADLEDFRLDCRGEPYSLTAVVKGYNSVPGRRVTHKDIAHQIWKANSTRPDHIMLVLAKPMTDGVDTQLVNYGKERGNRELVMIIDEVRLCQFLRTRGII